MRTKEYSIDHISVSMAVVDAIPVLLFAGSAILISYLYGSVWFAVGASCSIFAGICKVTWKLLLAWKKKNLFALNKLFRIFMIGGFALMLLSLLIDRNRIAWHTIWPALSGMPQCIFFVLGAIGMMMMSVFAKCMDPTKAACNWVEQITNLIAQGCFFVGLLMIVF